MSRGKRYNTEQKLNLKKVFAVIIAFIVIIMFFVAINTILKQDNKNNANYNIVKYYSVYTNGKWGVIDNNGDYIIQPTYEEMVVVPNNEKEVFLCVYNVNYSTEQYETKAINKNGSEIFTEYESIEPIENYDLNNYMWYEQNLLKIKMNGKYGAIDFEGNIVIPCEYDDIYSFKGYEGKIVTLKNGKYGISNTEGNILLNNEWNLSELEAKCVEYGILLEIASVPTESQNPKNIGKWHVSKDMNSGYYTDLDN